MNIEHYAHHPEESDGNVYRQLPDGSWQFWSWCEALRVMESWQNINHAPNPEYDSIVSYESTWAEPVSV